MRDPPGARRRPRARRDERVPRPRRRQAARRLAAGGHLPARGEMDAAGHPRGGAGVLRGTALDRHDVLLRHVHAGGERLRRRGRSRHPRRPRRERHALFPAARRGDRRGALRPHPPERGGVAGASPPARRRGAPRGLHDRSRAPEARPRPRGRTRLAVRDAHVGNAGRDPGLPRGARDAPDPVLRFARHPRTGHRALPLRGRRRGRSGDPPPARLHGRAQPGFQPQARLGRRAGRADAPGGRPRRARNGRSRLEQRAEHGPGDVARRASRQMLVRRARRHDRPDRA